MTKAQKKDILAVSEKAKTHIANLLSARDHSTMGIRLGVKVRGCSGYSYTLEYTNEQSDLDEVVDCKDFKIFIEPKAVMFFIGTIMDYEVEDLGEGFIFRNPNEKGRCGCGESFHI